jgi:threonine/homoserine/homoserine lactone efflux protein
MMTALATGAFLGLSGGLAPGPLLALVLAQTLRHGPREGCKIVLTPLVTDAPIILLALALATTLAELRPLLGVVSIAGEPSSFIWLGIVSARCVWARKLRRNRPDVVQWNPCQPAQPAVILTPQNGGLARREFFPPAAFIKAAANLHRLISV